MVEELDSIPENQLNSSVLIRDSSHISEKLFSCFGGSGVSVGVAATAAVVEETTLEFLEDEATGQGWLCSQEYVTTSMVGSTRLLSTCFLAGQPFELLHR